MKNKNSLLLFLFIENVFAIKTFNISWQNRVTFLKVK